MNNLIGEPQCVLGDTVRSPRRKFEILFRPWNFIRQARPYSKSQLFPALCPWYSPLGRSCDTRTDRQQNSIFANYSATFSHLPLFQMGHIVSWNIMNYFTRRFILSISPFPSLSLSHTFLLPSSRFSRQVYVDLYRAARPINISARTFACKSRRRGENDDASRNECTAHERVHTGRSIKDTRNRYLFLQSSNSIFFPLIRELLYRMKIYHSVFLFFRH